MELGLELGDLRVDLVLLLLVAGFAELLAGLLLGLALGILGRCDLRFDIEERPPKDGAVQVRHHGVDRLWARFGHVGEQGRRSDTDRLRELSEGGVGLIVVVEVEQRADQDSGHPAHKDPNRSAEDADQQPDETTTDGALVVVFLVLFLFRELPVVLTGDYGDAV